MAKIFHAHLHGDRDTKYDRLMKFDISNSAWSEISPQEPFYLLTPQNNELLTEYDQGWKITDIFPKTLLGPNSHRDHFAVTFDYETALTRIKDFSDTSMATDFLRKKYDLTDNRDWSLDWARKNQPQHVLPTSCIYRPFDFRFMLYGKFAFDYPRPEINDSLLHENLALISTRQTKEGFAVFVTKQLR